jgi:hypothetical protein
MAWEELKSPGKVWKLPRTAPLEGGHAGLKPSAYASVLTHQRRERCN